MIKVVCVGRGACMRACALVCVHACARACFILITVNINSLALLLMIHLASELNFSWFVFLYVQKPHFSSSYLFMFSLY